eukprot:TRINITY_DN13376_c0_g1_i1.p1 TRINITY_DN13376_c0_g1~~TRINITY_DN13376_c0_g1_i1.p1  ORF type:complete len:305 (+),score=40.24 TRINITY_DN13376_c0_g1_i1:51-965(+)
MKHFGAFLFVCAAFCVIFASAASNDLYAFTTSDSECAVAILAPLTGKAVNLTMLSSPCPSPAAFVSQKTGIHVVVQESSGPVLNTLDLQTGQVNSRLPLPFAPWILAFDDATSSLYGVWFNTTGSQHQVFQLKTSVDILVTFPKIETYNEDCDGSFYSSATTRGFILRLPHDHCMTYSVFQVDIPQRSYRELNLTGVPYVARVGPMQSPSSFFVVASEDSGEQLGLYDAQSLVFTTWGQPFGGGGATVAQHATDCQTADAVFVGLVMDFQYVVKVWTFAVPQGKVLAKVDAPVGLVALRFADCN